METGSCPRNAFTPFLVHDPEQGDDVGSILSIALRCIRTHTGRKPGWLKGKIETPYALQGCSYEVITAFHDGRWKRLRIGQKPGEDIPPAGLETLVVDGLQERDPAENTVCRLDSHKFAISIRLDRADFGVDALMSEDGLRRRLVRAKEMGNCRLRLIINDALFSPWDEFN